MKYFSTNKKADDVSFKDAVIRGVAPDGGLYFPERIEKLPAGFWSEDSFETVLKAKNGLTVATARYIATNYKRTLKLEPSLIQILTKDDDWKVY